MERQAFEFLEGAERSWWYVGRSAAITHALKRIMAPVGDALDFGAGFGNCYPLIKRYGRGVDALEVDHEASAALQKLPYKRVMTSDAELAAAGPYAFVGAFDVLEHLQDDVKTLALLSSRMQQGGVLAVTVPAYQWLWSEHDALHQHFRRYTKKTLKASLEAGGFSVLYISHWNVALLPVVWILRLLKKGGGNNLMPPAPINALLKAWVSLEALLMPLFSYPFGVSIVAVAIKN